MIISVDVHLSLKSGVCLKWLILLLSFFILFYFSSYLYENFHSDMCCSCASSKCFPNVGGKCIHMRHRTFIVFIKYLWMLTYRSQWRLPPPSSISQITATFNVIPHPYSLSIFLMVFVTHLLLTLSQSAHQYLFPILAIWLFFCSLLLQWLIRKMCVLGWSKGLECHLQDDSSRWAAKS